jgi:hypothetical protein
MKEMSFDKAYSAAIATLKSMLERGEVTRALLVPDIFGYIRVALWREQLVPDEATALEENLKRACEPFHGNLWLVTNESTDADRALFEEMWEEGKPCDETAGLRVNDRHRWLSAWLGYGPDLSQPWAVDRAAGAPPIVAFHACQAGDMRHAALLAFAKGRVSAGERVIIIELDLTSPSVSALLGSLPHGQRGVVDYFIEKPVLGKTLNAHDYCFKASHGDLFVFPAGRMDERYISKLARVYWYASYDDHLLLKELLVNARDALRPDWILVDVEAGLSESAGLFLGGLAHMAVLAWRTNDLRWLGSDLILRHIRRAHDRHNTRCLFALDEPLTNEDLRSTFDRYYDLHRQRAPIVIGAAIGAMEQSTESPFPSGYGALEQAIVKGVTEDLSKGVVSGCAGLECKGASF